MYFSSWIKLNVFLCTSETCVFSFLWADYSENQNHPPSYTAWTWDETTPPHTHTHNLKSQFRLHRLHYSLVFPCVALLFQDMPLQANNLIIHYRNFLKSPINSLIKTTNTSSSKTLCLKILTLLLPPMQILVYHKSYSVPTKPLHWKICLKPNFKFAAESSFSSPPPRPLPILCSAVNSVSEPLPVLLCY